MNQSTALFCPVFPFEKEASTTEKANASGKPIFGFVPPPLTSHSSLNVVPPGRISPVALQTPLVIPNLCVGANYETSDGFIVSLFSHSYSVEYPGLNGGIGRICSLDGALHTVRFGKEVDEQIYVRAKAYLNLLGEQITRDSAWGFNATTE